MEIGLFDAKNRLSELVERAAQGETIIITKRGTPAAKMGPVPAARAHDRSGTIAAIREFRSGKTLGDVAGRELLREGRA